MKVAFFQRKRRQHGHFSVEILFDQIRANLPDDIEHRTRISRFLSNGILRRCHSMVEAVLRQGEVNHVTGDVHFLAIGLKPRKTILTVLDVGLVNHPNPVVRQILIWLWITLPVKRANYITTISTASKKELLKYVDLDESKVRVIHVPVSSAMTYSPRAFNKSRPVILHVGTTENKNLLRLVEAVAGMECRLEIIGRLSEEQRCKLAEYGIDYGNESGISDEAMCAKYRSADMLAFVSTYEGFGMPIVEAQIVGRPVVTSDLLSMPEVAGDGAHLVDPFDVEDIRKGIRRVIDDDAYRESLVSRGRGNADRFRVEKLAAEYADLYREVYRSAQ